MLSLSFSEILAVATALGGVIGNIIYVSYRSGKIEAEVDAIKNDMEKDQHARDNLAVKFERVDQRVQGMETKIAGIDVKVDGLKEGVGELKKLMSEHLTHFNNK